jgi:small redox-active disulfide protein 2
MKVEVLGAGCTNCLRLFDAAADAVKLAGIEAEVVKVDQIAEIVKRGVLITPSLVIDGKVICSGRIMKAAEIAEVLADLSGGTSV